MDGRCDTDKGHAENAVAVTTPPARNGIADWFSHGPLVAIGPPGHGGKYGSRWAAFSPPSLLSSAVKLNRCGRGREFG